MLRLLAHRARAQRPLLVTLLAIVTLGTSLLGACALLLTRTAEQAIEVAAVRAAPDDVDVTAFTSTIRGQDARSVAADTRAVLTSALAPFTATMAARASSVPRPLAATGVGTGGVPVQGYLSGIDDLASRAHLAAGHWPSPATDATPTTPLEAVVLDSTARALGLTVGSRVRLGAERGDAAAPLEMTVVGIAVALPGGGWDRDPLAGAGYELATSDRALAAVDVYGPFIVDLADLLGSGSTLDRLEITAHPDLSAATRAGLDTAMEALRGADRQLGRTLGERVQIERVAAQLPGTLQAAHEQQRVTAAVVLAVAILGIALAATALALAGRLTAGVRAGETALLSALGVSRAQAAAAATVEAGALAVLAGLIAVPASSALHAGLTHLPPLVDAGLAVAPGVGLAQVLAVAAGALALAVLVVVSTLRSTGSDRRPRELLARSGADLLLVAFAALGWWQLRAQPAAASSQADAVRTLAPALLLAAGAVLALRLVRPALGVAERLARRARGLVLPLAAFEAARRPQAVAAGLLVGLACAAGTFGLAFDATWQRSQHDQADLLVGTDLALTLDARPTAGQGAAVATATGGVVSPAVDRGIAVGQWLGGPGDPPRLVALDTTRADTLLRGRLDAGRGWGGVGGPLAPPDRVVGVPIPAGADLTIGGTAAGPVIGVPLSVTPRLVLQDATGLRTACIGDPVPLDGRKHLLPACATAGGLGLVAVSLPVSGGPTFRDYETMTSDPGPNRIAVTLTVPSSGAALADSGWTASSAPPLSEQLSEPAVTLARTPAGAELTMTAAVKLTGAEGAARNLVATAFPISAPVPAAVSARFAGALGVDLGSRLTLSVGTTPVPIKVTEIVPTVPSAPGAAAVLVDFDTLTRFLIAQGDLSLPVDAWWVGRPDQPDAVGRATGLYLGPVSTRATETARLTSGPLRAALPAALRLLVPAAALLLVAGVVLHVTCDLQLRAVEVARLRGLGLTRREIRAVLLGQHAGVLLPLFVAGAAVGGLAAVVLAPLLVRSDTGAAAVPDPLPHWPWGAEAAFLSLVLAAGAIAVTTAVTVLARRADAAHLRMAS